MSKSKVTNQTKQSFNKKPHKAGLVTLDSTNHQPSGAFILTSEYNEKGRRRWTRPDLC